MRLRSIRIPRTARILTVAAIGAGTIAASLLQAGTSVADQSPSLGAVIVQSPAHLVARGAAVTVRTTVVCEPNSFAFLSVEVTENVGGQIASGGRSTQIQSCTGGAQDIDVTVTSNNVAFRKGTALGEAFLNVSGNPGPITDQRVIQIVR